MWWFFLFGYFVFATGSYLLRRVFAQKFSHHTLLLNGSFYVFFLLPATLIIGFLAPHNFDIGVDNLIYLLLGSLVWPVFTLASFRANKYVDAGIYTVIANASPIFTILIAVTFIGESLTTAQFLGAGIVNSFGLHRYLVATKTALKRQLHRHSFLCFERIVVRCWHSI